MMGAISLVLIALVLLLLVNIGYLTVRTVQDVQAARWGWVGTGCVSLIGVIGLVLFLAVMVFGIAPSF